ncbi:hypothetical protein WG904_07690 [Pedobacter sp. Du54]
MEQHVTTGNIFPLICIAILSVIVLVAAFSLTFIRKADTSDNKH